MFTLTAIPQDLYFFSEIFIKEDIRSDDSSSAIFPNA